MATLGEDLKAIEDQKTNERIARRSDMLRKFVKEDLLKALQQDIENGGDGRKALEAPADIRHLFAGPLDYDGYCPHTSTRSTYYKVWRELDAWAKGENLAIATGTPFDKNQYGGTPWDMRRWGGYLYISVPKPEEPVRPTPPALRKVENGANITMNEMLVGIFASVIITFLLTYFSIRH